MSKTIVCNLQNRGSNYRGGDGIEISDSNIISVDVTTSSSLKSAIDKKQNSLTAGNGISIDNNFTISNKFPYKDYKDSNNNNIDLNNIPWNEYYIGSLNAELKDSTYTNYAKNLPKNSETKSGEFICIPGVSNTGLMIFSPYNKPWQLWIRKYYSGGWQNWVEYAPPIGGGENISLRNVVCSGFITSSKSRVDFFIPTGRLVNYTSVKIKDLRIAARSADGTYYLDSDDKGIKFTDNKGNTLSNMKRYRISYTTSTLGVHVTIRKYNSYKDDTTSYVDNNTGIWKLGPDTAENTKYVTNNVPVSVVFPIVDNLVPTLEITA